MQNSTLDSALDVWNFLCNSAGLEPNGRDEAIISELRRCLQLGPQSIESELESNSVTAEEFVIGFLSSVSPFAIMMVEILRMFEHAGAQTSDENIQIAFNFAEYESSLEIDLNAFRAASQLWSGALRDLRVRQWEIDSLWRLNGCVRGANSLQGSASDDPVLRRWLSSFEIRGSLPPLWLPPPQSQNQKLASVIAAVWSVWTGFLESCHRHASSHDELMAKRQSQLNSTQSHEEEPWPLQLLVQVESDFWAVSMATDLYRAVSSANTPLSQDKLADRLTEIIEAQSVRNQSTVERIQILLDILSLPYWRFRYEMYSIWIGAVLVDALEAGAPRLHVVDKKILFSFTGTHLATIRNTYPELHLWAEHRWRHHAPRGKGRKGGIQPDFSLIAAPLSQKDPVVLAVECKHYAKSAKRNFSEAVMDYASGLPTAQIALANYGPISSNVLDRVQPPANRSRIHLFGELRPDRDEIRSRFVKFVCSTCKVEAHLHNQRALLPKEVSFVLYWTTPAVDFDLHVDVVLSDGEEMTVSYNSLGSLHRNPFCDLDHDARTSPGEETARVKLQFGAKYSVWVHWFTRGDINWSSSDVTLDVRSESAATSFRLDSETMLPWWHFADFDGDTGEVTILNSLHEAKPKSGLD
jgi:hypothetical protein